MVKFYENNTLSHWFSQSFHQLLRRGRSESFSSDDSSSQIKNEEFIRDFVFAREGYSVHSITSVISNHSLYLICGSKVGGIKVINALTGISLVENIYLTSSHVLVADCGKESYLVSCGRECSIPVWSIGLNCKCQYLSSLLKHTNTVNIIDYIYFATIRGIQVVKKSYYLVSGGNDHKVILWKYEENEDMNMNTEQNVGEEKKWDVCGYFYGHSLNISQVKFMMMNNMLYVISGDEGGNVIVWKTENQSILFRYKLTSTIYKMVVSYSNGRRPLLAISDVYGSVTVLDLSEQTVRYTFKNSHYQEQVRTMIIYDDYEERLLILGCDDGSIRFLSLNTGIVLHKIHAHRSWVSAFHIANECFPVLVSGGCDSKVKCWNLHLILCNIKYKRRKNFLLFLVGCKFIPLKSLPSSSSSVAHETGNDRIILLGNALQAINTRFVEVNEYTNNLKKSMFGNTDICSHIMKFL